MQVGTPSLPLFPSLPPSLPHSLVLPLALALALFNTPNSCRRLEDNAAMQVNLTFLYNPILPLPNTPSFTS